MENAAKPVAGEEIARIDTLLDALAETRRRLSALHAEEAALLASALQWATSRVEGDASATSDIPLRSIAAQIAAVLRMSDRTVQRRMDEAGILLSQFPATFAALSAGQIDRAHVQVIVEAGIAIDDDPARAAYEQAALDIARRETPGRLRPAVRTLAQRLHPQPLIDRHRAAATRRDVWVRDGEDGMAELTALLPAALALGIHDRITRLARTTVDADRSRSDEAGSVGADPSGARTLGQVRADVLADLLLTGHATATVSASSTPLDEAIVAQVQITVPVLTLLGHDTTPAELTGHAPIDLATARRLAAHAPGWDRILTHPHTGTVLAVDRYRPTEHQRRTLHVRDQHCRFPGCRQPAPRCDIDHTTAREHDGPTTITNLAHLCRRHHTLKHHSAWRVRQHPDGTLEWTSPTGRHYPDRPARTLVFTAETTSSSVPGHAASAPTGTGTQTPMGAPTHTHTPDDPAPF